MAGRGGLASRPFSGAPHKHEPGLPLEGLRAAPTPRVSPSATSEGRTDGWVQRLQGEEGLASPAGMQDPWLTTHPQYPGCRVELPSGQTMLPHFASVLARITLTRSHSPIAHCQRNMAAWLRGSPWGPPSHRPWITTPTRKGPHSPLRFQAPVPDLQRLGPVLATSPWAGKVCLLIRSGTRFQAGQEGSPHGALGAGGWEPGIQSIGLKWHPSDRSPEPLLTRPLLPAGPCWSRWRKRKQELGLPWAGTAGSSSARQGPRALGARGGGDGGLEDRTGCAGYSVRGP